MFSLKGKNALVTGAGAVNSMGYGVAECLLRQGANVCLVDVDRDSIGSFSGLQEAVDSLSHFGHKVTGIVADCTQQAEVERAFDEAVMALGSVDIAVACVGGGGMVKGRAVKTAGNYTSVATQEWDEYNAILRTTQFSTYFTCQAAARRMLTRPGYGRIIIIGSVMANFAAKGSTAYSGSKAAIRQMGKVMAHELGDAGITVNTIQPGWMQTRGEVHQTGQDESYYANMAQSIPARRMGLPKDIGAAAAFLCAEEAQYVSGVTLEVDGGFTTALSLPPPQSDSTETTPAWQHPHERANL
jgi:NAD(P)-dependent dehydrogenase (short-subunit alcohol dehydrogenase family)